MTTVASDRPQHVCSFESRRCAEMAELIERFGGRATVCPSMREIPLEQNQAVFDFANRLLAGEIDVVIFLTGVGAKALLEAAEVRVQRQEFLDALDKTCIIARGPKPVAVLREWRVHIDRRAPEPNTWRDLIAEVDGETGNEALDFAGKTVAVQEYGESSPELCAALVERGAHVIPLTVYRWALPEDTGPLQNAVRKTIAGEFDVLMFTSANQLNNVLQVADDLGVRDQWLEAAKRTRIASIGPTASERIRSFGLQVDLEPPHPKMGHLVRETLQQ